MGVTEAAGKLQDAGLIKYNRGHITVLDRKGLEARACECYRVVRRETIAFSAGIAPKQTTASPHVGPIRSRSPACGFALTGDLPGRAIDLS